MGIALGSNFTVNTALPLDDRILVADLTARDAIPALRRYLGMEVYVESEEVKYFLKGGIDNANWEEAGTGSGGGGSRLNLVEDGSFESGDGGFFVSGDGSAIQTTENVMVTPTNEFCLKAELGEDDILNAPTFIIPAPFDGVIFNLSFWIKNTQEVRVFKEYLSGPELIDTIPIGGWVKKVYRFGVNDGNNFIYFNADDGAEVFLDEFYFGPGNDLTTKEIESLPNGRFELVDSSYTMNPLSADFQVVDTTLGDITITLPSAALVRRPITILKKVDVNNLILEGDGAETINGSATKEIYDANNSVTLMSDGTNWWVV